MPRIPGMKNDVYFGHVDQDLADWREEDDSADDDDEDEATDDEKAAVHMILGFDPNDEDQEAES